MTRRLPTGREVVSGVGVGVLGFAMVVVFVPDLVPAGVLDLVESVEAAVDAWMVTLVLSLVVFAYALHRFRQSDVSDVERLVESESSMDVPDLDDGALDFDPERAGRTFDYAVARSVAQLERDPNGDGWEASQVRTTLREAVHAVRGDDEDAEAVSAAIEAGSWTDDRVAAAFLGGPDAPGVSLWRRLYAWLYPARAFERRVERVVDVIERQGTVAVDGRADRPHSSGRPSRPNEDGEGGDCGDDGDGGASEYGRDHGDAVTGTRSDAGSEVGS